MNNNYNYQEIVENYKKGNLKFSIELSKARIFLMSDTIYTNRLYLWSFINNFLLPISTLVLSIIEMGILGGIVYSIIAFIFYFSINGTASINIEQAITTSVVFAIIGILLKYLANVNLGYNFVLTIIQYISSCYFYKYIGKTIIDKVLLVDETWFNKLLGDIFYISK